LRGGLRRRGGGRGRTRQRGPLKDGAAETAAKWEKGDSQIRLFLHREEVGGVKKTVKNGRLYLGDVEVGQVLEADL